MDQDQYDSAPNKLTLRELSVGGKTLITTFLSPELMPKHELKKLYKNRWHIELDFRHIKTTLGMETLSCKTLEMNEKEIWVYFLAYNLIRLLMAQRALMTDVLPRQLSFKHTLQLWLAWSQLSFLVSIEDDLFILITQRKAGNRPGRVEPRAVKRRPKPMPLLMKPRAEARANVMKMGIPKKLK
jgi:Transposase DDE domain